MKSRKLTVLGLALIVSCLLPARAGAATAEEAEKLAGQNGRPILIVEGRYTCGNTTAVLGHLQEPALLPLVSQYVSIFVDCDKAEGRACEKKFGHPGNTLPFVFVVRADGEKLFSHSGYMESMELRALLVAQAAKAGKVLTAKETALIEKALKEAKRAREKGDAGEAIKPLLALKKLGPPGSLNSFAKPAVEANHLVAQLTEEGKTRLKELDEKLSAGNVTFDTALEYARTKRACAPLAALRSELAAVARKCDRQRDLADTVRQAEAVDRALVLAAAPHGAKRATEAFQRVIAKYPDTVAAKVAAEELKKLGVEPAAAPAAEAPAPAARTWTDTTGRFKLKGVSRGVKDGKLQIETTDGRTVHVPLEKLSEADRDFLKSHPAE